MKTKMFFNPEDAGGNGGNNKPVTNITYKFGDEEVTVDLSNPDQINDVKDLLSKGRKMEKMAEERNKLKKSVDDLQNQVDVWNNRLENARGNSTEFGKLVKDMESELGVTFTAEQKRELKDPDPEIDDPVMKQLLNLQKNFDDYRTEQERKDQLREKQIQDKENKAFAQEIVSKLETMEKDTEKYPGFDKEAIYDRAKELGTTNFEMVYFYENRDKLIKAERSKVEQEYEKLKNERQAAQTENDASGANIDTKPKKFRKLEDVGASLLGDVKAGNLSFFTED